MRRSRNTGRRRFMTGQRTPLSAISRGPAERHKIPGCKRTSMVRWMFISGQRLRLARRRTGFRPAPMGNSKFCSASTGLRSRCSTKRGSCRTSRRSRLSEREDDVMKNRRTRFCIGLLLATIGLCTLAQAQSVPPSPGWTRAMPSGPDARVKITEEYVKQVGRDAYFWAWPMVNVYNRRLHFLSVKEIVRAGPLMEAPANRLAMLTDYVDPDERSVACPNQDVVYGFGALALDISPLVIQVPDFGDRFWVYQIVDLRTDSFVQLGKMYGATPGFYLLVGPNWKGDVPKGITKVFRSPTNTGIVAPRIFLDDTPEDKRAIQCVLPDKFVDELPAVLADAPPLPGEEARYAQVAAVLAATRDNPKLKQAFTDGAKEADEKLVKPLFQFRNYGQQLPHN